MKRFLLSFIILFFVTGCAWAQIAKWTFEGVTTTNTGNSPIFSVGSAVADAGSQTGGSLCTAFHADALTVWSNPAGNGSGKSISSNHWGIGDYYQFLFNTTGYQDISITWDATGSATGPRDFKVQYSTDGSVFTDATGINSTYQLTGEAWSTIPANYNPASTRTLDLNFVTALNNNATVYIRLVVTSAIAINSGAVAIAGTSRVDDFTVNGSLIPANTITITGLSSTTFNLADCFATASGTVDFTSTDVFNGGNIFTAQLSDASGSFATPTNIGSLAASGTAPGGTISITIPNGTASGTLYKIRIVSSDPVAYSNLSADITINQSGTCVSSATDFFRSRADGSWNSTSTWESSLTGTAGTWIPATLTPTSAANTITIRNSHTVTVTLAVTIDQVIIESLGVLVHSVGVLTINDDASGDDVIVQSGGVFTLSFLNNPPVFSPLASASAIINTGGILRVTVGGMTAAGAGVNASNYIYQDASVLELTTAFSTAGVTYFPNANAATIPIFRTTGILSVGAGSTTTFNGVFEANSSTTFISAGDKIFRNGIKGTGNINGSTSGTFFITGLTAELGGAGSLTLPVTGLQIGTPTTVTMISDKTITGNVSLLTDTYVELGNNNLTVSGTVTNATITSYVKTNGTGKLTLLGIAAAPFGGKLFPIGLTSINPLYIFSATTADYSARIVEPITPPIYNNVEAVLRTWYITSSVISPFATISFGYSYPADCGVSYNNSGPVEVGVNVSGVWNIHQTFLTPAAFIFVPGTFIVTPGNPINYFNGPANEFPFVVANNGAILPIDCIISTRAQKRNNTGIISWTVNSCAEVNSFEVQRSVNNSGFQTIGIVSPVANQTDFNFTDPALAAGTNLYRIKVNSFTGSSKYSNTVALIHNSNDILISSLAPNPVHNKAMLVVSSGRNAVVDFNVYNMSGSLVKQWQSNVAEGNNTIEVNLVGLSAGMYAVFASANGATTVSRFVKQ